LGLCRFFHVKNAAIDLVALDAFKQGFKIALAKAIIALALNKFEEDRAELCFREDLQEQAGLAAFGCAIKQEAAGFEAFNIFAMTGQAAI